MSPSQEVDTFQNMTKLVSDFSVKVVLDQSNIMNLFNEVK